MFALANDLDKKLLVAVVVKRTWWGYTFALDLDPLMIICLSNL